MIETALLFLVFNRPGSTRQVFEAIRQAKPSKLYVAADGIRPDTAGEEAKVQKVRAIATNVDWDCEVKTLFRDQNLGCKIAVSSAITWFFEHEEEGIILEDDCLPNQSFFKFCDQMLSEYRNDSRIMMISGTNYLFNQYVGDSDYFCSRYFAIWGWATWRRAWKHYDISMKEWPTYRSAGYIEAIFGAGDVANFYNKTFDHISNAQIDTWDLQWVYSCIVNYGLSIVSTKNLIANIGIHGTHTSDEGSTSKFINMPTEEIKNKIKCQGTHVSPDSELDKLSFYNIGILKNEKKKVSWLRRQLNKFT